MAGAGRSGPTCSRSPTSSTRCRSADFTPARDARAKELKAADPDSPPGSRRCASRRWRRGWSTSWCATRPNRWTRCSRSGPRCGRRRPHVRRRAASADRQRRQLTAAVTTRARALANEHGHEGQRGGRRPGRGDPDRGDGRRGLRGAVRSGLLVAALAATGVDAVELDRSRWPSPRRWASPPRPATSAAAPHRPDLHVVPDPDADAKAPGRRRGRSRRPRAGRAEAAEAADGAGSGGPGARGALRCRSRPRSTSSAPDGGPRGDRRGGRRRARRRRGRPRRGHGRPQRGHRERDDAAPRWPNSRD